jgi:hypothetical protein
MLKNITGSPCPSCGTTRAIQLLLNNIWIVFDLLFKKESFYKYYQKAECIIRSKWVAILLIILVIVNWIWNIKKEL